MVSKHIFILALVVATQSLWGSAQNPLSPAEQTLVERAETLVETETSVAATGLTLVSLEAVDWNDASLGCPQPGMMYAQVVTPGYRITLQGPNGETYDVHTGSAPDGGVVLCAPATMSAPKQSGANSLTGTVWQWQTDGLEDTSNYTVEFLPGGQLAIQADCNRGRASYQTFGENGLRVGAVATTRAACPPGSLERVFLEQVVSSSSYTFDGENLLLYPVVDPGTMLFTPVTSAGRSDATNRGEPSGRVAGVVTYRERVALPPGSVIQVTLQDVSRADAAADVLDTWTFTTTGENVPIAFELAYDPTRIDPVHRYTVRAEIRDDTGGRRWTSDIAYPVITGGPRLGNRDDSVEILLKRVSDPTGGMPPAEPGRTSEFMCTPPSEAAFTFGVKTGPGEVALTLPERFGGRSLVLPQVRAASGARFEEGGVVFWNKGDEALLQVDGQTFEACLEQAAGIEDEVMFRAAGSEPFWLLVMTQRELRFQNLGEPEVVVPLPIPETGEATGVTTYHAVSEAHNLRVSLTEVTCTDSMSGQAFEMTVTVTLDGETYEGCGRRPE